MKPVTLSLIKFFAILGSFAFGAWAFGAFYDALPRWLGLPLCFMVCVMCLRAFLKDIIKSAIREAWED